MASGALDALREQAGVPGDPGADRARRAPVLTQVPVALDEHQGELPAFVRRYRVPVAADRRAARRTGGRTPTAPLVPVSFGTVVPTDGHYPGLYRAVIDALVRSARAGARDGRSPRRPGGARAAAGQRPRRALGGAGERDAARRGDGRPRRRRDDAGRARRRRPARPPPAVRRPADQRPARRGARGRRRARRRRDLRAQARRGRHPRARGAVLPRGGAARRSAGRHAALRRGGARGPDRDRAAPARA